MSNSAVLSKCYNETLTRAEQAEAQRDALKAALTTLREAMRTYTGERVGEEPWTATTNRISKWASGLDAALALAEGK